MAIILEAVAKQKIDVSQEHVELLVGFAKENRPDYLGTAVNNLKRVKGNAYTIHALNAAEEFLEDEIVERGGRIIYVSGKGINVYSNSSETFAGRSLDDINAEKSIGLIDTELTREQGLYFYGHNSP